MGSDGLVVDLCIGREPGGPMTRVTEVTAVAGHGLQGDRYFKPAGTAPDDFEPSEEITLIESEGIEAARSESGIDITTEDTRRNVVTARVRLDNLIGQRFWVGEVEVEGLEANPPCRHLAKLAGKELLKPLITRGGIRGRIAQGGIIRVGDRIRPSAEERAS